VVVVLFFALAAFQAPDRVIGLLKLPEVFGEGPCKPFEPRSVPLYADPDGTRMVGAIEVDQNWSFAPHGGCEGLEVRVHRGAERSELPTREYEYEAPAAIVLETRRAAFRIRLASGSAWVRAPFANRFMPYESLLEEYVSMTYRVEPEQPVRVIETRRKGDVLWLHAEVLSHSLCAAADNDPPRVIAGEWIAAYDPRGEPAVWFWPRGC
jgi:hypothetical protein